MKRFYSFKMLTVPSPGGPLCGWNIDHPGPRLEEGAPLEHAGLPAKVTSGGRGSPWLLKLLLECSTGHAACPGLGKSWPSPEGSERSMSHGHKGTVLLFGATCPSQDIWLNATPSLSGWVWGLARPQVPPESARRFQIHQVQPTRCGAYL